GVGRTLPDVMDLFLNDKRHAVATAWYFSELGERIGEDGEPAERPFALPMTDEQWARHVVDAVRRDEKGSTLGPLSLQERYDRLSERYAELVQRLTDQRVMKEERARSTEALQ